MTLLATDRVFPTPQTCNIAGRIRWQPIKTAWLAGHALLGMVGLVFYPAFDAVLIFVGLIALSICAGHAVGMHRVLIHRAFACPRGVEATWMAQQRPQAARLAQEPRQIDPGYWLIAGLARLGLPQISKPLTVTTPYGPAPLIP